MALLLLICLTVACLPVEWPAPPFGLGSAGSALLTGAITVVLLLIARVSTLLTLSQLRRPNADREAIGRAHGLRRTMFFFLNLAGLGLALGWAGWGQTVRELLTVDDLFLPGAEFLTLAPYLIALVGSWAFYYDAERGLHEAHSDPILRSEFWSRGGYIVFLLRHHLLMVFLPVLLVIAQLGLLRVYPELLDDMWAKLAAFAGLFVVILFIPSMVPLVLGLQKLPPGPLRDRLEASAQRIGVRYRQLYVWDTRGNLATAMVTGLVPRFRQIVFTDLLLQSLSEDEVEAVFGHEVGHVRHGHLLYYAVFLMLSFLTLGAAYRAIELATGQTLLRPDVLLILSVVATGVYLFLVFGFLSRRCERQADVFGCRAVSCGNPMCESHEPNTVLLPRGRGLCRTGIGIFIQALDRVENINGMARGAATAGRSGVFGRMAGVLRFVSVWLGTWQHSTIARRVAFLETLAENPRLERRFQWKVTLLRWGLLLILLSGVVGIATWKGWRSLLEGV